MVRFAVGDKVKVRNPDDPQHQEYAHMVGTVIRCKADDDGYGALLQVEFSCTPPGGKMIFPGEDPLMWGYEPQAVSVIKG